MEATQTQKKPSLPAIVPATSEEIVAYLRRTHQFAEIAVKAEHDALIYQVCQQLDLTVTDEELQVAGDAFRVDHKLLSVADMMGWFAQQRITAEDWTEGIRFNLLSDRFKEFCFGAVVDNHYMSNREQYRRLALSQILVRDYVEAVQIANQIQEGHASFCAMALEHSQSRPSNEYGGFMGIQFFSELIPEIAEAIAEAPENQISGPVQTKLGYHVIRIEKWFPLELNEATRKKVLDSLFQLWLQKAKSIE